MLRYYNIILHDVSIGRNGAKCIRDLGVISYNGTSIYMYNDLNKNFNNSESTSLWKQNMGSEKKNEKKLQGAAFVSCVSCFVSGGICLVVPLQEDASAAWVRWLGLEKGGRG